VRGYNSRVSPAIPSVANSGWEVLALVDTSVIQFLEFLSVEKGASGNTVAAYRNDLGQLEEFLSAKKNGSAIQWTGINQNHVLNYILYMKSQSYAEATVARKVAAVKSFFSFLQAEGRLKINPTETLASPKVGKSLPKPLTVQEIDELLEQPARRNSPEAKRDRAMLELMYATGLRVTELVSLDISSSQPLLLALTLDVGLGDLGSHVCPRVLLSCPEDS